MKRGEGAYNTSWHVAGFGDCAECGKNIAILQYRYETGFKMFWESHPCINSLKDIPADLQERLETMKELEK